MEEGGGGWRGAIRGKIIITIVLVDVEIMIIPTDTFYGV